jgi:hypothetical protein
MTPGRRLSADDVGGILVAGRRSSTTTCPASDAASSYARSVSRTRWVVQRSRQLGAQLGDEDGAGQPVQDPTAVPPGCDETGGAQSLQCANAVVTFSPDAGQLDDGTFTLGQQLEHLETLVIGQGQTWLKGVVLQRFANGSARNNPAGAKDPCFIDARGEGEEP